MTHQSYLLLGEGDFTFSLDMCRYLASLSIDEESKAAEDAAASSSSPPTTSVSITCTGVDTIQELSDKYKDIEFILRNIRSSGTKEENTEKANTSGMLHVNTTILHGINAVQAECSSGETNDDSQKNAIDQKFDDVLFHHPHLGTEDAQLHSRFLQHFFHAALQRWMKPKTGLLHLTLVDGQCSRWKCIEGAEKHGLVLLRRKEFMAPPPPTLTSESVENGGSNKTYYELRRHQSGKSFANRRRMQGESVQNVQNESETLVFGRACNYSSIIPTPGDFANNSLGLLPWETLKNGCINETAETQEEENEMESASTTTAVVSTTDTVSSNGNGDPYPCPHCPKSFQQHRSLKNHMMNSHPDCEEVRAWKLEKKNKKKKGKKRKLSINEATECLHVGDKGNGNSSMQQSDIHVKNDIVATVKPRDSNDDGLQGPTWICVICASHSQDQPARQFPHRQALLDHQRAKHLGAHSTIKPDWCQEVVGNGTGTTKEEKDDTTEHCSIHSAKPFVLGSCPICDLPYFSELDKLRHEMEFVPSPSVITDIISQSATNVDALRLDNDQSNDFKCVYCSKQFCDRRAQLQHQNFCSLQNPF